MVAGRRRSVVHACMGSNGPPSKVWMGMLIFAGDGTTELGDKSRKRPMSDVSICSHSSCRLKSPLALSSKNFLSTKVARGAQRVNIFKLKLNLSHSPTCNSPLRSLAPYSLRHYDPHNYLLLICKTLLHSIQLTACHQTMELSPFPSQICAWLHTPFSNPGWRQYSHLLTTSSTNLKPGYGVWITSA